MILDFTREAVTVHYHEAPQLLVFHTVDHPHNEGCVYRVTDTAVEVPGPLGPSTTTHQILKAQATQELHWRTTLNEHVIRRDLLIPDHQTVFQVLSAYRTAGVEEPNRADWDRTCWMVVVNYSGGAVSNRPRRWEVALEQFFDYRDDGLVTVRLPVVLTLSGYNPDCHDPGPLEAMTRSDLPPEVRIAAWQHLLEDRPCL